jgi:hypothetical protein
MKSVLLIATLVLSQLTNAATGTGEVGSVNSKINETFVACTGPNAKITTTLKDDVTISSSSVLSNDVVKNEFGPPKRLTESEIAMLQPLLASQGIVQADVTSAYTLMLKNADGGGHPATMLFVKTKNNKDLEVYEDFVFAAGRICK